MVAVDSTALAIAGVCIRVNEIYPRVSINRRIIFIIIIIHYFYYYHDYSYFLLLLLSPFLFIIYHHCHNHYLLSFFITIIIITFFIQLKTTLSDARSCICFHVRIRRNWRLHAVGLHYATRGCVPLTERVIFKAIFTMTGLHRF